MLGAGHARAPAGPEVRQIPHLLLCLDMAAVEISSVTKTFGAVKAVDDLSLLAPEGAVYGFIGPNGSGKTTTMRMIVNIFYPDSGAICVFGEAMTPERTGLIGYL